MQTFGLSQRYGTERDDQMSTVPLLYRQTFLSTRQGAWVLGRMSTNGVPLDIAVIKRINNVLFQLLPKTLVNWAAERALNNKYDHILYGLKPKHR